MVSIDIVEGNPGAMTFLMDAYDKFLGKAELAFQKMQDNDIRGEKLYLLWNDCCNRDTEKAIRIILDKSIPEIKEHINHAYEHGRGLPFE